MNKIKQFIIRSLFKMKKPMGRFNIIKIKKNGQVIGKID